MSMQKNYQIVEEFISNKNIEYYKYYPFSKCSSFNIGGNIDLYIVIKKVEHFLDFSRFCYDNNIMYFIIRDKSKIVVSDDGYSGIMVSMEGEFEQFEFLENGILKANSSAILERLSHEARIRNLSGLEFVVLVNIRLGASIYDKLESFGTSLINCIKTVTIFNKKDSSVKELTCNEYTALTDDELKTMFILSATLKLTEDKPESIDNRIDWFRYVRGTVSPTEANIGPIFEDHNNIKAYEMVERIGGLNMEFGDIRWHKRFPNYIVKSNSENKEKYLSKDVINLIEDTRKKIEQHYAFEPRTNIIFLN